ncbi:MAG: PEP-CTERM sorting domain-containing protein [Lentisphaeria bacterium]
MKKSGILTITALTALLSGHPALANVFFTDTFTTGPSTNWSNTSAATYTGGKAMFSNATRNYIYTTDTDYSKANFVATVQLTNTSGGGGNIYFGMGAGLPDTNFWDEPRGVDGSYVLLSYAGKVDEWNWIASAWKNTSPELLGSSTLPAGTTITAQMVWNAASSTATISLDTDNNGTYDYSTSIVNTNMANVTSRLFVGGQSGVYADNFSVVPEPASLALLALGGLCLLRRRQR